MSQTLSPVVNSVSIPISGRTTPGVPRPVNSSPVRIPSTDTVTSLVPQGSNVSIPLIPVVSSTTRPPSPSRSASTQVVQITKPPSPVRIPAPNNSVTTRAPTPTATLARVPVNSAVLIPVARPPTPSTPVIPVVPASPVNTVASSRTINPINSTNPVNTIIPTSAPSPVRIVVPVIPPSPGIATKTSKTPRTAINNLATRPITPVKITTPNTALPMRPSGEIMQKEFEVRNYQGIISNASIENELLNVGYTPLSKIVVRSSNGEKRTQYIKAVNRKGQKVYILIDVNGYTTAKAADLTFVESQTVTLVPYSLKVGAYECAGTNVCGVAFECGADTVCVISRGSQDLNPKEASYIFVERQTPSVNTIESKGAITSYPVIRLTEIRSNPPLVLQNTDVVTRRLRNTAYMTQIEELANTQKSIDKLNQAFTRFNNIRETTAPKLTHTLRTLEQYNDGYLTNPPSTDELKDRYRRLQFNLSQRNDNIVTLLQIMKRVDDNRAEIDAISREINELSDIAEKELSNVDLVLSE